MKKKAVHDCSYIRICRFLSYYGIHDLGLYVFASLIVFLGLL